MSDEPKYEPVPFGKVTVSAPGTTSTSGGESTELGGPSIKVPSNSVKEAQGIVAKRVGEVGVWRLISTNKGTEPIPGKGLVWGYWVGTKFTGYSVHWHGARGED